MVGQVDGTFRNQSLRSTSLTQLHEGNVPEQAIKEFSGHHSNAVRSYKRTSHAMKRAHSEIIQGTSERTECKTKSSTVSATVSKPLSDHSDSEDFAPETMKVCTPKQKKMECEHLETSDTKEICSYVC